MAGKERRDDKSDDDLGGLGPSIRARKKKQDKLQKWDQIEIQTGRPRGRAAHRRLSPRRSSHRPVSITSGTFDQEVYSFAT
ncbi:MAG TPA: hypothetical protein PLY09_10980, partial [Methanothrix sp.]|nr:hypothetical protein [Methanothrix sp.]HPJ85269.1 hypothetical protein [Methanothrix sp.]